MRPRWNLLQFLSISFVSEVYRLFRREFGMCILCMYNKRLKKEQKNRCFRLSELQNSRSLSKRKGLVSEKQSRKNECDHRALQREKDSVNRGKEIKLVRKQMSRDFSLKRGQVK